MLPTILLIRSDIFSILIDPDLNKIRQTNTVTISWGEKVTNHSPLLRMIVQKAKKSSQELALKSDQEAFDALFPQPISGHSPESFILERTLFRPRDVITYLRLIAEKYPLSSYFPEKGFIEFKSAYSDYFYEELRNEMIGHIDQKVIDQGFRLLKNFNKFKFMFEDLKQYYERQKRQYPDIQLEDLLVILFKFNIIGNKWYNEFKNKYYYTFSHRDINAEIDFEKEIIVHLGLRESLSM